MSEYINKISENIARLNELERDKARLQGKRDSEVANFKQANVRLRELGVDPAKAKEWLRKTDAKLKAKTEGLEAKVKKADALLREVEDDPS